MGGHGSGTRYSYAKKTTVEDCLVFSAAKLIRHGTLKPGLSTVGSLIWSNKSTGKELSRIGFDVNLAADSGSARLHYRRMRADEPIDYRVRLTTTPLPRGGLKWWFFCPLMFNDRACGRRVGKLYLPPGARYFGCRHCHDLTYTSCQESHKYDALFAGIGAPRGLAARDVARLLKRRKW